MSATTARFFIALLPSQAIQDEVSALKQVFVDRYNSRAALKSPPHITLQPPFEWSIEAIPHLSATLREFGVQVAPMPIALSGFGAFAPRVIYINVIKSPPLLMLQAALVSHLEASSGIVDEVGKSRSFTPHMTVGFRDLTKENFKLAWAEFQLRPLEREWLATQLTLLQHDGQRWNVHSSFPFTGDGKANLF
ncbi:MAG: 2'-5' RNA ligase family protein [Stenomitos rutilans HA7619-LM2]|nr:2'-5' RNA ligase family protein [Stenomitos rutilans HA7619-LM2]